MQITKVGINLHLSLPKLFSSRKTIEQFFPFFEKVLNLNCMNFGYEVTIFRNPTGLKLLKMTPDSADLSGLNEMYKLSVRLFLKSLLFLANNNAGKRRINNFSIRTFIAGFFNLIVILISNSFSSLQQKRETAAQSKNYEYLILYYKVNVYFNNCQEKILITLYSRIDSQIMKPC